MSEQRTPADRLAEGLMDAFAFVGALASIGTMVGLLIFFGVL